MCKLFMLSNTSKLNKKQLKPFIKRMSVLMTQTERDGFGYAAFGSDGVFGERYLNVDNIDLRGMNGKLAVGPNDADITQCPDIHNSFGAPRPTFGGLVLHSRTSTNTVSLRNTHPFIDDNYAMSHNGIVDDVGEEDIEDLLETDCDSEIILVNYSMGGIERVSKTVAGYYALGMIDLKTGGLIVVHDATSSLYAGWIDKLDSYAFGTTRELVEAAMKFFKASPAAIDPVRDNIELVFDNGGTLVEVNSFLPKQRSFGSLDEKSIGRSASHMKSLNDDVSEYWRRDWTAKDSSSSTRDYGETTSDVPNHREVLYYDERGRYISEEEFNQLTVDEQMACEVVDGMARRRVA